MRAGGEKRRNSVPQLPASRPASLSPLCAARALRPAPRACPEWEVAVAEPSLWPQSRLGCYGGRTPRWSPPLPRPRRAGPRASAAGPSRGYRSPALPRGTRQLSRAPCGPRQAGNLLLFVECFCHANPRAGRWRSAQRRWGGFAFFFPWPLQLQLLVLLKI